MAEVAGAEVVRTQWLDFSTVSSLEVRSTRMADTNHTQLGSNYNQGGLLGRKILVVDEVDDTRRTLMSVVPTSYAV